MILGFVMDELGTALKEIPDLRVHPYWIGSITPPSAVVGFPDPLTYDLTMARGMDRQTFPIFVCVGKVDTRTSRDAISKYCDGAGDYSVKQVIENHECDEYDSARVDRAQIGVITIGAIDYLSATFYVDIIGRGV